MRFVLIALLVIHGLIHLIGLSQARVAPLWAAACAVLLGTAVLVLSGARWWWTAALVGIVLSQALVLSSWSTAKGGTIANALIAVAIVVSLAQLRFARASAGEIDAMFARVPPGAGAVLERGELARLPAPVARWLEASGVVGKPRARTVRLRQRGALRTAADQPWMPATATQYVTLDEPAFVWTTAVRMKHVLPIAGRDHFLDGRGRMLVSAAGLVPVVDASGPAIDEGALQRYLAEVVWYPSAALAPYVTWTALDDHRARATMAYRGTSGSVDLTFDDEARVQRIDAQRYLGAGAEARRQHWVIHVDAWGVLDGVTMPTVGVVGWDLASGPFPYFRWEVTALEYDRRTRWAD